jgi:hypothetical protein
MRTTQATLVTLAIDPKLWSFQGRFEKLDVMRVPYVRSLLLAIAVILLPIRAATAQEQSVTVVDGLLTVRVENRPLLSVLEEIARQARVAIDVAPGAARARISQQIANVPVEQGLRFLLIEHDAFFFYGVERDQPSSVRAIWVYPKGKGQTFAPVPSEMWASTGELRSQLMTNQNPAERARATEAVIERGGDQAVDVVLTALLDGDENVRASALYASLNSGVRLPADRLAQLALTDPSPDLRFLALEALAEDRKAMAAGTVGAIASQALLDASPHVQRAAKEILGRLERAGRSKSQSNSR